MALTLSDLLAPAGVMAVVLILVQLVKRFVPEDYIQHVAVLLGIVLAIAAQLVLGPVTGESIGNAALTGGLGGAAAVGLYQLQQPLGLLGPREPDATPHG